MGTSRLDAIIGAFTQGDPEGQTSRVAPDHADAIQSAIQKHAQRRGISPELLTRQVQAESNFDPNAVSSANARGLMQIVPEYHPNYDVQRGAVDPDYAIGYGTDYLASNIDRYGGDVTKGLAAYHAGPGNVDRAIERAMVSNSGDWLGQLGPQTQAYVKKVASPNDTRAKQGVLPDAAPDRRGKPVDFAAGGRQVDQWQAEAEGYLKGFQQPAPEADAEVVWDEPLAPRAAPDNGETSWADYGKAFQAGTTGLGSMVGAATEWAGGQMGSDFLQQTGESSRQYWEKWTQDIMNGMTPEAVNRLGREFLTLDPGKTIWQGNPTEFISSIALKLSQTAPSNLVTLLPGALMMRAAMGTRAIAYLGATEGAMSLGGVAQGIADEIEQAPEEELMQSQEYQQLRQTMDEVSARRALTAKAQGMAPAIAGLIVGAIGAAAGKYLEPVFKTDGMALGARVTRGAISEGALQEAPQSAAEQVAQNVAAQVYDKSRSLGEGVAEQAVQGGVLGGIFGGAAAGALGNNAQPSQTPPQQEGAIPVEPPAQPPGPQLPPEAQQGQQGSLFDATQAPTPTAEPVGDLEAQIAAMDGKKRRGVYLSPDNVNHLYATQRADLIRGRNFVANVDGQGGVLVVDSPQTEYEVKQRLNPTQAPGMQPEPLEKILGDITGAGKGKPTGPAMVVQTLDAQGNVAAESVKPFGKKAITPGKNQRVMTPEEAQLRRAQGVQADLAGPVGPQQEADRGLRTENPNEVRARMDELPLYDNQAVRDAARNYPIAPTPQAPIEEESPQQMFPGMDALEEYNAQPSTRNVTKPLAADSIEIERRLTEALPGSPVIRQAVNVLESATDRQTASKRLLDFIRRVRKNELDGRRGGYLPPKYMRLQTPEQKTEYTKLFREHSRAVDLIEAANNRKGVPAADKFRLREQANAAAHKLRTYIKLNNIQPVSTVLAESVVQRFPEVRKLATEMAQELREKRAVVEIATGRDEAPTEGEIDRTAEETAAVETAPTTAAAALRKAKGGISLSDKSAQQVMELVKAFSSAPIRRKLTVWLTKLRHELLQSNRTMSLAAYAAHLSEMLSVINSSGAQAQLTTEAAYQWAALRLHSLELQLRYIKGFSGTIGVSEAAADGTLEAFLEKNATEDLEPEVPFYSDEALAQMSPSQLDVVYQTVMESRNIRSNTTKKRAGLRSQLNDLLKQRDRAEERGAEAHTIHALDQKISSLAEQIARLDTERKVISNETAVETGKDPNALLTATPAEGVEELLTVESVKQLRPSEKIKAIRRAYYQRRRSDLAVGGTKTRTVKIAGSDLTPLLTAEIGERDEVSKDRMAAVKERLPKLTAELGAVLDGLNKQISSLSKAGPTDSNKLFQLMYLDNLRALVRAYVNYGVAVQKGGVPSMNAVAEMEKLLKEAPKAAKLAPHALAARIKKFSKALRSFKVKDRVKPTRKLTVDETVENEILSANKQRKLAYIERRGRLLQQLRNTPFFNNYLLAPLVRTFTSANMTAQFAPFNATKEEREAIDAALGRLRADTATVEDKALAASVVELLHVTGYYNTAENFLAQAKVRHQENLDAAWAEFEKAIDAVEKVRPKYQEAVESLKGQVKTMLQPMATELKGLARRMRFNSAAEQYRSGIDRLVAAVEQLRGVYGTAQATELGIEQFLALEKAFIRNLRENKFKVTTNAKTKLQSVNLAELADMRAGAVSYVEHARELQQALAQAILQTKRDPQYRFMKPEARVAAIAKTTEQFYRRLLEVATRAAVAAEPTPRVEIPPDSANIIRHISKQNFLVDEIKEQFEKVMGKVTSKFAALESRAAVAQQNVLNTIQSAPRMVTPREPLTAEQMQEARERSQQLAERARAEKETADFISEREQALTAQLNEGLHQVNTLLARAEQVPRGRARALVLDAERILLERLQAVGAIKRKIGNRIYNVDDVNYYTVPESLSTPEAIERVQGLANRVTNKRELNVMPPPAPAQYVPEGNKPGYKASTNIDWAGHQRVFGKAGDKLATWLQNNTRDLTRQTYTFRLRDLLNTLASEDVPQEFRQIFNALRTRAPNVDVVFGPGIGGELGTSPSGKLRIRMATNLYGQSNTTGALFSTLMHESVHAALTHAMATDPKFYADVLALMREVEARARATGNEEILYAVSNPNEFLAQAFSSPAVRNFMANQSVAPRTLWQRFLDTIARIFGGKRSESALDALVRMSEPMISDTLAPADMIGSVERDFAAGFGRTSTAMHAPTGDNTIDAVYQQVLGTMEQQRTLTERANSVAGSSADAALGAGLQTLTFRMLMRFFGNWFSTTNGNPAVEYNDAALARESMHSELRGEGSDLSRKLTIMETDSSEGRKAVELMSKVMTDSTLYGFHVDKPLSDPANAHVKSAKRIEQYEAAQKIWNTIKDYKSSDGHSVQSLYGMLREYYAKTIERSSKLAVLSALRGFYRNTDQYEIVSKLDEKDVDLDKLSSAAELQKQFPILVDDEGAAELISRIARLPKLREGPYFPLSRPGKFVIHGEKVLETRSFNSRKERSAWMKALKTDDPTIQFDLSEQDGKFVVSKLQVWNAARESRSEADALAREMRAGDFASGKVYVDLRSKQFGRTRDMTIPTGRALGTILEKLEGNAGAQAAIKHFYLQMIGDASFRKHEIHRDNVLGVDPRIQHRAFAFYFNSSSYYIAQLKHGWKMAEALNRMEQVLSLATSDSQRLNMRKVVDEFMLRDQASAALTETPEVARRALELGQFMLLTSPSYWMVNSSQPYVVTAPWLAARFGGGATVQALLHAQRLIGGTVFGSAMKSAGGLRALWDRKTSETIYSVVDNIKRNIKNSYAPEESTRVLDMLEYLRQRNLLDLTFSTEGRDVMREGYSAWERVMTASRAMAHLTEVNNRIITAHATYQLAFAKSMAASNGNVADSHKAAMMQAEHAIDETQGDYSAFNKSRLFSGKFGWWRPLVFQFMQYPLMIYTAVTESFVNSMRSPDPQVRKIARKTFVGLLTTHVAAAGAIGFVAQPLKWMISLAAMAIGDDDEPFNFEKESHEFLVEAFGQETGDAIAKGIPYALGLDLSKRLAPGNIWMFNNPATKEGQDLLASTLMSMTGPVVGLAGNAADAVTDYNNGNYQKMFEKLTPKVLRDLSKAQRLASEGMTDFTGKKLIGAEEFTFGDLVATGTGFQTTTASKKYDARTAVNNAVRHDSKQAQKLKRKYFRAEPAERPAIWREIAEFSRNNPEAAITYRQLYRSMRDMRMQELGQLKDSVYLRGKKRSYLSRDDYLEDEE